MMVTQQTMLADSKERALAKTAVVDITKQQPGFNQALLASLACQNVHGLSLGSLKSIPSPNLPLGYPLGFNGGMHPSLQAHLLMGRPLLNPFSGLPTPTHLSLNASAYAPLASGIRALQGNPSQQPNVPIKDSGYPNDSDIKQALATLAAAAAPADACERKSNTSSSPSALPAVVFMECDEESLSDYQCMLRKQIELFEASAQDVQWNAQGRNKPIVLGQVGIRCRWCASLPTWSRSRGAVYYSATLDGLYQAAQNMAKNHICKNCRYIVADTRQELSSLRQCKRRASGGKKYWAEGAKVLGVYECEDGLRFKNSEVPVPPAKRIEIEQ